MANATSSNSSYADSVGVLSGINTKVVGVLITATAANATATLVDAVTNAAKFDLRNAVAGTTQHYRFENIPVVFPGGVKVGSISNAIVTVIYTSSGG